MYNRKSIRASAVTTGAYVAGTIIKPKDNLDAYDQLNLLVAFTKGSLTSMDVKIDYSDDGETWYQETFSAISSGVSTESPGVHRFSTTGNQTIAVSTKWRFARISVLGNGTVTNSLVAIDVILGNV